MSIVMKHVATEIVDNQGSSWVTQPKNAQKEQGHIEVPTHSNIAEFSHQTHEANQHKTSAATKKRKQLIADSLLLKQDWLDAPHWRRIAKESRFRLADYYQPLSTKGIRRTLAKLGLTSEDFRDFYGEVTYDRFVEMNPTMPLWAFQGCVLEVIEAFCIDVSRPVNSR
jgi:hypothetical protein